MRMRTTFDGQGVVTHIVTIDAETLDDKCVDCGAILHRDDHEAIDVARERRSSRSECRRLAALHKAPATVDAGTETARRLIQEGWNKA